MINRFLLILISLGFSVSAIAQSDNKIITQSIEKIPVASILGKSGGEITQEELLKAEKIDLSDGGKINLYTFVLGAKGKGLVELRYEGNELGEEVKKYIKGSNPGNALYFENIYYYDANRNKNIKILSLKFIIK